MSAPPNAAFTTLVVRPVGTTRVGCGVAAAVVAASTSSTDCVENHQDTITLAGSTPAAAFAMPRCACVTAQSPWYFTSRAAQLAGGFTLAYRASGPKGTPCVDFRSFVITTR